MGFFYILRENGMDWEKAKETFYNLTDYQIAWLNGAAELESKKQEDRSRKASSTNSERKSFDLR
jgi:hypothetical protein